MDSITLLRQQLANAHQLLEGTLGEVTADQAHTVAAGSTASIAANYAHAVLAEDFLSSLLDGGQPLLMGEWAQRTGVSEPPPMGDWEAWGKRVQVDLPQAREYAQAVYGKTDALVANLTPEDLERTIDLSAIHFGQQTIAAFLSAVLVGHPIMHAGEISAYKGLQGLQGYPF